MPKPTPRVNSTARQRGNVLVLVVVVLGLLALMGGAYLQTARVQRQMYFDAEDCSLLARGFVIDSIKGKLKDDIFDPETGRFFDVLSRTEPYDRAWTNGLAVYDVFDAAGNDIGNARGNDSDDTWLASPLPFFDGTVWRWRQISTLNGTWFDTNGAAVIADRRLNPNRAGGADPDDWYGMGSPSLRANTDYNIPAFTDTSLVDADADGMPDSRLQRIDSFATKNGVEYFAAVRVIDLASFLNVNTSLYSSNNTGTYDMSVAGPDAPRGANPSELNLGQVIRSLTNAGNAGAFYAEMANFVNWRGVTALAWAGQRLPFWINAGSRLGNVSTTGPAYEVLDDLDELQLRYRGGAFDLADIVDNVSHATNGMEDALIQGLGGTLGTNGIDTALEANGFFPYAAVNTTGTRIRFTTASAEALYGMPTPRESTDAPDTRVLKTALNDERFDVRFRYPPPDPAGTPLALQATLGGDDAFGAGQDSVAAPVARPGLRVQDMAEALTDLAYDVKAVFNAAYPTDKAAAANNPGAGSDPLPTATVGGTAEAPILFGNYVGANEAQVNLFATQFAANLKDYIDDDNVLTVLDVDGMRLPDRDANRVRMFPLNNTWTDPATIPGGEPAPPTTAAPTERYGFELLPYITEVYVQADYEITAVGPAAFPNVNVDPDYAVTWDRPAGITAADHTSYAIEIRNPYNREISLSNIHLRVAKAPATAGSSLPVADEWTTDHPDVAAGTPDADYDGDGIVADYDLADLVTHQLRLAGALAADEKKDTLDPDEVLILYRNAYNNAAAAADDAHIVDATLHTNVVGPGIREPAAQQWPATTPANGHPATSVIDDTDIGLAYTYVEVPFVWPDTTAPVAALGQADDHPDDAVTLELYAAVANDANGFDTGVTGGADASAATIPNAFNQQRYQVVDKAIAPVVGYASDMYDLGGGTPVVGTRVTMQHSTVGNANGVNAMLILRADFDTRTLFPRNFDVTQGGDAEGNENDELVNLVGTGVVATVTRRDVYDDFFTDLGVNRKQNLLAAGNGDDKVGANGYFTPAATAPNRNVVTPAISQVIVPNAPIVFESEIAHLLIMGIEPIGVAPLFTGSTADSFQNAQTLAPTAPNTLDHFRLNFGLTGGSVALPGANNSMNNASPHWDKPHARVLLERLSAISPTRDGVDNDGNGLVDDNDPGEQVLAGRLNLNHAELGLVTDALPFGNVAARISIRNAVEAQRDDTNLSLPPMDGIYSPWDLLFRTAAPLMPNAQIGSDEQSDGSSRIDFVQNELSNLDGTQNDVEQRFLFAGGTQQVTTTRSDVYVAYILVQGYRDADGDGSFATAGVVDDGLIEQSRSIVIFDRSKMVTNADAVEARVLYEFPK